MRSTNALWTLVVVLGLCALQLCSGDNVWKCDFDNHNTSPPCNIEQLEDEAVAEGGKALDWTLHHGATRSSKTGPDNDHTKAGAPGPIGYYFYMEVSGLNSVDNPAEAAFLSPDIGVTEKSCLSFWFHMFGEDIGQLEVKVISDDVVNIVWIKQPSDEEKQNAWLKAQVVIPGTTKRLGFTATHYRSNEPYGDIAVDDISVDSGECTRPTSSVPTTTSTTTPPTTTQSPTTESTTTETTTVTTVADTTSTTTATTTTLITTTTEDPSTQETTTQPEENDSTTEDKPMTVQTTKRPGTGFTTDKTTGSTNAALSDTGSQLDPWIIGVIAGCGLCFLLILVIFIILCKRRSDKSKDNRDNQSKAGSSRYPGNSTRTDTTMVTGNRESTGSAEHHIYSSIDSFYDSNKPGTLIPPPPNRPTPATPGYETTESHESGRGISNAHAGPPRGDAHDKMNHKPPHSLRSHGPPDELAPLTPMLNPVAGLDLLEDTPAAPPPDQSWPRTPETHSSGDRRGNGKHSPRHKRSGMFKSRGGKDGKEKPSRDRRHRRRHHREVEWADDIEDNNSDYQRPLDGRTGYIATSYPPPTAIPMDQPPPYDASTQGGAWVVGYAIPRPKIYY